MRDNSSFIPATFCPFLSNKFPRLNIEEITARIEEDLPLKPPRICDLLCNKADRTEIDKVEDEENEKLHEFVEMFETQHKLM